MRTHVLISMEHAVGFSSFKGCTPNISFWAGVPVVCAHALGNTLVIIRHLVYNVVLVKVSFDIWTLPLACLR